MITKRFSVIVSCLDCGGGQDPLGCFNGGSETIGVFDTKEEAEKAGYDYIKDCCVWNFEIVEEESEQGDRG